MYNGVGQYGKLQGLCCIMYKWMMQFYLLWIIQWNVNCRLFTTQMFSAVSNLWIQKPWIHPLKAIQLCHLRYKKIKSIVRVTDIWYEINKVTIKLIYYQCKYSTSENGSCAMRQFIFFTVCTFQIEELFSTSVEALPAWELANSDYH